MKRFNRKVYPRSPRREIYSGGKMKKRGRTAYSKNERQILEKCFKQNPYLDAPMRNYLCKLLGYNSAQLKVWYQNHRMKCKREWAAKYAEATEEDGVSSSGSPTKRKVIAQIRSRRCNKSGGTCSGSSPPTLPSNNSMDIQMNSTQASASYNSDTDLPNIANVGISPPRMNAFRPPQANGLHASRPTPSMIQGSAPAATPQPTHNLPSYTSYMDLPNVANVGIPSPRMAAFRTPQPNTRGFNASIPIPSIIQDSAHAPTRQPRRLQFHHSLYINSPYLASPPLVNSDPRYGYNMHQNQGVSHASAYNSQKEVASMRRANEFNLMYHATVRSSQNLEYQTPSSQHNYANYGAMYSNDMRSNQEVNSSSHPAYEGEDSEIRNLRADFNRLQFTRSFPNSGASFTGNATTHQGNPYETQQLNSVKNEFPRYPLHNENSGSSQHTNHSVPNHFNLNRNFPAPGVTANTSSSTFPTYPNTSFNQANSSYPSQIPASDMLQNLNYVREYEQERFLVPPNTNLPGYSKNEASTYPTSLDYSSTIPDEQINQNFSNLSFLDRSDISSRPELFDHYKNYLFPETSDESLASADENHDPNLDISPNRPEESDIPSWEQIFSEPLRTLEDTADIECSAQPTNSTSSQSFS